MKYTNLQLVQDISSSIDGDEINSVSDTVESLQILTIVKNVLDDMVSRGDLSVLKTPFNLVPSGDDTKPVLMQKPSDIDTIDWIKYNCVQTGETDPVWKDIKYLKPETFLNFIIQYRPSESNIDTFSYQSAGFTHTLSYRNDTAPQFYTSFDDQYLIFDAFDSAVEDTLQANKTLCHGKRILDWQEIDTYIPPLQDNQFQLLLNEAKSIAWAELRQTPNAKVEQNARRNWSHIQKTRRNVPSNDGLTRTTAMSKMPNFGRK